MSYWKLKASVLITNSPSGRVAKAWIKKSMPSNYLDYAIRISILEGILGVSSGYLIDSRDPSIIAKSHVDNIHPSWLTKEDVGLYRSLLRFLSKETSLDDAEDLIQRLLAGLGSQGGLIRNPFYQWGSKLTPSHLGRDVKQAFKDKTLLLWLRNKAVVHAQTQENYESRIKDYSQDPISEKPDVLAGDVVMEIIFSKTDPMGRSIRNWMRKIFSAMRGNKSRVMLWWLNHIEKFGSVPPKGKKWAEETDTTMTQINYTWQDAMIKLWQSWKNMPLKKELEDRLVSFGFSPEDIDPSYMFENPKEFGNFRRWK